LQLKHYKLTMTKIISPSMLSADFGNLQAMCEMINQSKAEWLHFDVMDGVFVPNISFGFPVIESVKKHCRKMLDVHIMIVQPEKYVQRFAKAGAGMLTFHYEATENPQQVIDLIRAEGIQVGISINPDVPVSALESYIKEVDMVLLMSVFAGFGGQKFIEDTYNRIDELKKLIELHNPNCLIEIDGGVNLDNAPKLFEHGVNVLVAGSTVFNANDPKLMIEDLLSN
jgi:ribulose-phosphate 3-epimerase